MNQWWQLWPQHFSRDECQQIVAEGLRLAPGDGTIGHGGENRRDDNYRRSRVRWLPRVNSDRWSWLFDRMEYLFQRSNQQAFGFHLSYFHEVQFTEYDAQYEGKYDWHEDLAWVHKDCSYHRKLSMVVQLSDPETYEGGNLEVAEDAPRDRQKAALRKQGTVMVFPSFLKHRVTAVTSGVRYSLVSWYEGPPFR